MKVYIYSQVRQKLTNILKESKSEEIVIRRRSGDMFSVIPKSSARRSPFDVPCLGKRITRKEMLKAVRKSRERA